MGIASSVILGLIGVVASRIGLTRLTGLRRSSGASSGSRGEPHPGADAMRSGGPRSGHVSERDRRSDDTHKHGAANGPCVVSMTSLNVPERMNALSDGVIRPFNTTREGRHRSI